MEYEEVKKALDEFTFKRGTKGFFRKEEVIYKHGDRFEDPDGFRYSWAKPVGVRIAKKVDSSTSLVVFSGRIVSLKLRKEGISFSIVPEGIPKGAPDHIMEIVDNTQNFTKLSSFNEFEIGADWAHK